MRVGLLIDRWDPGRGGAERALALLARRLEERGLDVRVFARSAASRSPGTFRRVRAAHFLPGKRAAKLGRALVRAAREDECEVTIGIRHLPRVDLYWPHGGAHRRSWEAKRLAQGERAGGRPRGRHRTFLALEDELLEHGGARRVVCVSELARSELAELHPACNQRLLLCPNGVDLEAFHPNNRDTLGRALREAHGIAAETPLLVFAGRDGRLKGLPWVYQALAGLTSRPWILLVAGVRHKRRWKREAQRAGLPAGRVQVLADQDPRALFAGADLTLQPTWRDLSSLALLQSLASGTPLITTRRAGDVELFEDPEVGSVVESPNELEALRGSIERWLERIERGTVDRERVRGSVAGRGLATWLDALEEQVRALAPSPS